MCLCVCVCLCVKHVGILVHILSLIFISLNLSSSQCARCANRDCSIDRSPLVSIQCVHGHRNNKKRKAMVMFKMVAVEIIVKLDGK